MEKKLYRGQDRQRSAFFACRAKPKLKAEYAEKAEC